MPGDETNPSTAAPFDCACPSGRRAQGGQGAPSHVEGHDSISEKVVSTLASVKHIPAETISLDSRLEDLGIDSLDTIVLLSELEKQFRISISDDEARAIRSVRDVVEGIRKLAAPPSCEAASPSSAGSSGVPGLRDIGTE